MNRLILFTLLPAIVQAAPVIDFVSPPTGWTQGGTVNIYGSGLDDNDPLFGKEDPIVRLNNQQVAILGDPSPSQITFTLPPGQGANLDLQVTLDGQSTTVPYSYTAPAIAIAGVTGTSPTEGGGTVQINGTNFGFSGTVTIGGVNAQTTGWNHSGITAVVPAGQGTGLPVVVTAGGQLSPSFIGFSYPAPNITGIAPGPRPTSGAASVTLNGTNFGTSAVLQFNSVTIPVVSQTHSSITFTLPEGEGTAIPVQVEVGGQQATVLPFDYDPPAISGISPASGAAPAATEITLTGTNFGLNPSVTFGAGAVVLSSFSHTEIVFTRPPGEVGVLEVTVEAAGQLSDHTHFLSSVLSSPPGYYIDVANAQILPAPAGRIAPFPDMTQAFDAQPGFYAPVPGMSQAIPASPGYFVSLPGASTQTPAPAGTFAEFGGQAAPTPAAQGHYTPISGMRTALPAEPGYYVPAPQATNQIPASAGRYAAGAANQEATLADAGFYAPIVGMRDQIQAPAGTYSPTPGSVSVLPLPSGYESPDGVSLTPLPQIQVVEAQFLPGGDYELTFSTNATDTYGVFYSENLVDFTLLQTAAGTGADVQVTGTPPNPAATQRFWIVGPIQLPTP